MKVYENISAMVIISKLVFVLSIIFIKDIFFKRRYIQYSCIILSSVFFTNCATIIKGPNEQITFTSEPTNAEVIIDDSLRARTPFKLDLSSADNHSIEINIDTNKVYQTFIKSSFAWEYLIGNIYIGGLPGIATDWISKSWYTLDRTNIHVVFTDSIAYEKDVFILNSYASKDEINYSNNFFLSGVYNVPTPYSIAEYDVGLTYMVTKNWGGSIGYYGSHYKHSNSHYSLFEEIKKIDAIYIQAYFQKRIFKKLYYYTGFGISFVSYIGKPSGIFSLFLIDDLMKETEEKIIIPNLQLGIKYQILNSLSINMSILTSFGIGVSFVF